RMGLPTPQSLFIAASRPLVNVPGFGIAGPPPTGGSYDGLPPTDPDPDPSPPVSTQTHLRIAVATAPFPSPSGALPPVSQDQHICCITAFAFPGQSQFVKPRIDNSTIVQAFENRID